MADLKQGENKIYVGENEEDPLAEIHFVPSGSTQLIVDKTYVADELRGQGIAQDLVKQMVSFARQKDKKIIPTCPFTKEQIDKNPEYQDVLSSDNA